MDFLIVVIPLAALVSFLTLNLTQRRGTGIVSAVFFIMSASLIGFALGFIQAFGNSFTDGSVFVRSYTIAAFALSLLYALAIDFKKQRNRKEVSDEPKI